MTDGEIRASYRDAKDKVAQVSILAQLNDCSTDDIRIVLGKNAPEPRRKKRSITQEDTDRFQRLHEKGLHDSEIAQQSDFSTESVGRWRRGEGLKVNRRSVL